MSSESPLTGKYLVQNPALATMLKVVDGILGAIVRPGPFPSHEGPPRRLLLSFGGHLGDAIIGSAVLPLVREYWPDTEIGLLTASWAAQIFEGDERLRWTHIADHWFLNRSAGRWRRFVMHHRSRSRSVREVARVGYDVAIDFYPYFGNNVALFHAARIPRRIGYVSGGFGPLLTDPVQWEHSGRHTAEDHVGLLRRVGMSVPEERALRYSIPRRPSAIGASVRSAESLNDYIVVHMGAGLPHKEWPRQHWSRVVTTLSEAGQVLVFTGHGDGQREAAEQAIAGRKDCHNLCDLLSWSEFGNIISGARLVLTVDSVAGHLAAAMETPVITLSTGVNPMGQWAPLGERALTLTRDVICSPCYRSRGCETMMCLRGLTPEQVLAAVAEELGHAEIPAGPA